MNRRLLGLAAVVLFTSFAPGCGSGGTGAAGGGGAAVNPAPAGEADAAAPENSEGGGETATRVSEGTKETLGKVPPAERDQLLLAYANDPDTLNVLTSNDTVSTAFQRWVYDTLATRDFHNPDNWVKELAEDYSFDPDTLTYTIKLRKGVKWHPMALPNGQMLPTEEFDADDVLFTFACILNPNVEAASLRSYYEDPDAKDESERYKIRVDKIDDHTVTVRWSKPYFLADEFTLGLQPIPEHVYSVNEQGDPISFDYASKEFADGFNNHWANTRMCGTGPMILKEYVKNERLVLERNPDYYGAPFYFSRAVFQAISNPNTMLQKVLQNELDWSTIAEKDHYIQSKENENVKAGKVVLNEYDYPGYRYLGYNQQRPFFADKKVRQALSHTVPIDEIIQQVYYGLASRVTGPFQPGSSASDESLKPIPFDLAKAGELLDSAGWKDSDGDGLRDKVIDGAKVDARFDLMIYSDSPQYLTIAEIIKSNCQKVGVEAQITPAKWALMLQKLRKKEFDACILGWAMSWKQDPYQIWHSSQADVPESSNSIGYKNPEVDKLIEELRVTMDPAKQTDLYHQIHRLIYEDQPYTFLFADKATAGRDSRLEGIEFFKLRPCYDVREWRAQRPRL
jgi:peptide/nickel transport system substrate-binding protein